MTKDDVTTDPRLAGQVKRFHTWPQIHQQTNGEHTFQVIRLYLQIFGTPRADVMTYIVKHDLAEIGCGDPPYPIKAQNPVLKSEMDRLETAQLAKMDIQLPVLTPEEKNLFKFCDLLDCIEHAKNEVLMGNQYMRPVFDQGPNLTAFIVKMTEAEAVLAVIHCGRQGIHLNGFFLADFSEQVHKAYHEALKGF